MHRPGVAGVTDWAESPSPAKPSITRSTHHNCNRKGKQIAAYILLLACSGLSVFTLHFPEPGSLDSIDKRKQKLLYAKRPGTDDQQSLQKIERPLPTPNGVEVNQTTCAADMSGNKRALNLVEVATPLQNETGPRIFCYILTVDKFHETKVRALLDTWAQRCDKFFVASNSTDDTIGAVEIPNTRHTYNFLWEKHRETLRFLHAHGLTRGFDWMLKADDDSYIVMENLRAYLQSAEIANKVHARALQLGYHGFIVYNPLDEMPAEFREVWSLQNPTKTWRFAHGGASYAMNHLFLSNVLNILDTRMCLNQEANLGLGEDSAMAFCASWFANSTPYRTLDSTLRERFHPYTPAVHYQRKKKRCCSSESISFHQVSPDLMRYIDLQLHECRALRTVYTGVRQRPA